MYTREEVMRWVLGFLWERVSDINYKKEIHSEYKECTHPITLEQCNRLIDQINIHGMLFKEDAALLQSVLEHYHEKWLDFYKTHYTGLALMNRTHDNLAYYYEAYYYFCRPGTYII